MVLANIVASLDLDTGQMLCMGSIDVLRAEADRFYAVWRMVDSEGKTIGGRSREYFFGDQVLSDEQKLSMVRADIENFRIGRRRVFRNVTLKHPSR